MTRSRARTSSTAPAANRDTSVRHAPTFTAVLSPQVWPKEWNSGSPPKMTSCGPTRTRSFAITSTFIDRFPCDSSAPLGCPVVPDV